MNVEALKSEALLLPRLERIELLQWIVQSIAEEEKLRQAEDEEVDEELKSLLLKRLKDLETGKVKAIPFDKFKAKILEEYGIPA